MPKSVKMMSEMNTTMMEVECVNRVGERLMITGTMMGNFPAEIYVDPGGVLGLVAMHLRPSPLSFVLGLPYFYWRSSWRSEEPQSAAGRLRSIAVAAAIAAAGGLGVIVVLLGLADLVRRITG